MIRVIITNVFFLTLINIQEFIPGTLKLDKGNTGLLHHYRNNLYKLHKMGT